MGKIFIGFILIFLDFTLNLNELHIGLIPDFLGYIIMINGLEEMAGESSFFMKVKAPATCMVVYTGILYVLDFIGISVSLGLMNYILALISTIISLYISYYIVMGVIDIEKKHNRDLKGENLRSIWTVLAILNIITYILLLIPQLVIISLIVGLIVNIYFLVTFNNSKNLYYNEV